MRYYIVLWRYSAMKRRKNKMNHEEKIREVIETASIVEEGENEIVALERKVATTVREVCRTIFSKKYRLPRVYIEDLPFWADIGIMMNDQIQFTGDFHGYAQLMRISVDGKIKVMTQNVYMCRRYDLNKGSWHSHQDVNPRNREATDHEVAIHAVRIASQLLDALKTRINIMKDEKTKLEKIAEAI